MLVWPLQHHCHGDTSDADQSSQADLLRSARVGSKGLRGRRVRDSGANWRGGDACHVAVGGCRGRGGILGHRHRQGGSAGGSDGGSGRSKPVGTDLDLSMGGCDEQESAEESGELHLCCRE